MVKLAEYENIVYVTPEMFGYKDRGLLKYQGLMLSDHNDMLIKEKCNYIEPDQKVEMSDADISSLLYKAFANQLPILIQANVLHDGIYYKDLECMVIGQADSNIYLQLKDGRTTNCKLEQIRNVELMNPFKWYDK